MTEKSIKDIIYENRKKRQLTQEQLADMLNVSNKTISKWENGISYPDVLLIPQLANALNISINELFNSDDMNPEIIEANSKDLILKYRQSMLLSILLLVFSPIPFVIVYFFQSFLLSVSMMIMGVIMILLSIIISVFSTEKIYDYSKSVYHHEKIIKIFKKYYGIYNLLLYIPFFMLPLIVKNHFIVIVLSTISYFIFALVILLIMKIFKIKIKLFKNLILVLVSILFFISGFILMVTFEPLPYILFYFISQIINYMILFVSNKIKL